MKTDWIIDCETDNLLDKMTKMWVIVCKQVGTQRTEIFSNEDPKYRPLSEFPEFISTEVKKIVWHNGIRFDQQAIEILMEYKFPEDIDMVDTLIISRVLHWAKKGGHSLKNWGISLGIHKGDFSEFDKYSQSMVDYCAQDTIVNEAIYMELRKMAQEQVKLRPSILRAIEIEHDISRISAQQCRDGWQFDFEGAQRIIDELTVRMREVEEAIEPHLPPITRLVDKEPITPRYKKNGEYQAVSARQMSEFLGREVIPEDALRSTHLWRSERSFRGLRSLKLI